MAEPLRVTSRLTIPGHELTVQRARSGGPGGQNVNKVESKVVLRFSVRESRALGDARRTLLLRRLASRLTKNGELVLHVSTHREQHRNEVEARERLARILAEALHTPKARRATRPTRAARERRLSEKKRRGDRKRTRRRPETE